MTWPGGSPRRSKYGAKRTTVFGVSFASRAEAARYVALRQMQQRGEISDLVLQPRFTIVVNGVKVCTYVADFRYRDSSKNRVVEELCNTIGSLSNRKQRDA